PSTGREARLRPAGGSLESGTGTGAPGSVDEDRGRPPAEAGALAAAVAAGARGVVARPTGVARTVLAVRAVAPFALPSPIASAAQAIATATDVRITARVD